MLQSLVGLVTAVEFGGSGLAPYSGSGAAEEEGESPTPPASIGATAPPSTSGGGRGECIYTRAVFVYII